MEYLLQPRWLISPDFKVAKNPSIVIEDKAIVEVTINGTTPPTRGHERKAFKKGLICPAFVNAHTHLPETLLRGLCDDKSLHEWLFNHIWKVEPQMTSQDAKIGALLGCAELIASGSVGFIDQYFYAGEIAEAVFETGIKGYLFPSIFGKETMQYNPETDTVEESFERAKEVYAEWNMKENRIFVGFGPHAPFTVTEEWLNAIAATAASLGTKIHIHLNETQREVKEAKEQWGMTPIEKVKDIGILEHCLAAHCLHVTGKEIVILRDGEIPVLHCPQSNLKVAAGIAPIPKYLAAGAGDLICLGTDGQASNNNLDILEEVMLTAVLHKGLHHDPTSITAAEALQMATRNPAQVFPNGSFCRGIEPGEKADLVVFDFNKTHLTPVLDPLSNLVYSAHGSDVQMTMSNGKILYENGQFLTLDIDEIMEKASTATGDMCRRAGMENLLSHL
ncbi:MAG: amidohydrolase [Candidatus Heimdallarchaeota archaeon]